MDEPSSTLWHHPQGTHYVRHRDTPGVELVIVNQDQWTSQPYQLDDYVLTWVQSGDVRVWNDQSEAYLRAGDVAIFSADTVLRFQEQVVHDAVSRSLCIARDLVASHARLVHGAQAGRTPKFVSVLAPTRRVRDAVRRAVTAFELPPAEPGHLNCAVAQLIQVLVDDALPRESERGRSMRDVSATARAREYIHKFATESPSLDAIASHIGSTKFQLLRDFRRTFGITPHAYALRVRINEARRMIRDGTPFAAVAAQTGFCDQSHFSHTFKRIVGVSPGVYAEPACLYNASTDRVTVA